jgi:hypothetical protein
MFSWPAYWNSGIGVPPIFSHKWNPCFKVILFQSNQI